MLNRKTLPDRALRVARPRAELRAGRTDWYRIVNATAPQAEIYIYNEIGWFGTTADDFVKELRAITAAGIDLHINSPGGEIFDGIAIYNCLLAHPAAVTTYVDSLAASIASVIAMAGDKIIMGRNSQMMIHDGMGLCVGNAEDMRRMADDLDVQSANIASVYADRAGGTVDEWRERMRAETWYSADEAVSAGLADEVVALRPGPAPENNWDLSVFQYAGRDRAPAPVASAPQPREPVSVPAPAAPALPMRSAPEPVSAPLIAFSPDDFRGIFEDLRRDAPALPDPVPEPVPVPVTTGLPFDMVDVRSAVLDSLRSASRPAEPDNAPEREGQ